MASQDSKLEVFNDLVNEWTSHISIYHVDHRVVERFRESMRVNTLGGKLFRLRIAINWGTTLLNRVAMVEELRDFGILGWLAEIFIASYTVADDIMDNGTMRRGEPCWYLRPTIGMSAVNDAFALRSSVYYLLEAHFQDHPSYHAMSKLLKQACLETEIGQAWDLLSTYNKNTGLDRFTPEYYETMNAFKSTSAFLWLPIGLVLLYLGIEDKAVIESIKLILEPMGVYFQMENDYRDVYTQTPDMKTTGVDVKDNRFSWLIMDALGACDPKQREVLEQAYGKDSPHLISQVLKVYAELDLQSRFQARKLEMQERLHSMIESLDGTRACQKKALRDTMDMIVK